MPVVIICLSEVLFGTLSATILNKTPIRALLNVPRATGSPEKPVFNLEIKVVVMRLINRNGRQLFMVLILAVGLSACTNSLQTRVSGILGKLSSLHRPLSTCETNWMN